MENTNEATYPLEYLRHRERIRAWLLGGRYFKSVEALEFAARFHTGMRKDGQTPEFHHQISIAHYIRTLHNLRGPEDVFSVSFLHDTIEDRDVSHEEIEARFGTKVKDGVLLLSKKYRGERKNLEDYYKSMMTNSIASIVKGADRVHNFQTCSGVFTIEKQERYIAECEMYIFPMLKEARNNFPDQELAYENIKHALKGQIELLKLVIGARHQADELRRLYGKDGDNTKGS